MPYNHKPKLKTKKPTRISIRQLVIWVIAGLLLIAIATITTKIVLHRAQVNKIRNTQLTTLNAAATDLKPIYDQLITTMPNIRSKNYEKNCGKSSDVLNNGTITCSVHMGVITDNYDLANLPQDIQAVKQLILKGNTFQLISEGKVSKGGLYGYTSYYADYTHTSGLDCYLRQEVDDNSAQFNKAHNSKVEYGGGIYLIGVSCNKIVKNFLPGYKIDK